MALRLARALHDPEALWLELQAHWQRGHLVGLAPPQERPALAAAVLGLQTAGRPRRQASDPQKRRQPQEVGRKDGHHQHGGAHGAAHRSDGSPQAVLTVPGSQLRAPRQNGPSGGEPGARWIEGGGGASLVLGSGGSSGGRRWCLQPLEHLQASARACGTWLAALGIDPGQCLHLDALPLHHVSGLMPLLRARQWGAELRWLPPDLLRHGEELAQACPLPPERPVLLSLVPTQLHRLLESPEATAWLRGCAVIWVGGSALTHDLATRARDAGLPLAPCYGATETAAMVCALPPRRFLAGEQGCGPPLGDVELRLEGEAGAIAVRCGRISPGWFKTGRLKPFRDTDGWWRSGDGGGWSGTATSPPRPQELNLMPSAPDTTPNAPSLVIHGRLDGAIHSGGETVFPEQVRQQLLGWIRDADLPVRELLLLGEADPRWGQRLVALVRWESSDDEGGQQGLPCPPPLTELGSLAQALPPSQRPRRWLTCPTLTPTDTGKWKLDDWRQWLLSQSDGLD